MNKILKLLLKTFSYFKRVDGKNICDKEMTQKYGANWLDQCMGGLNNPEVRADLRHTLKLKLKNRIKKSDIPDIILFNVDNFNNWFCDDSKPKEIYANKGIYLRLDKLSYNHIEQYFKNCYNIHDMSDDEIYDFKLKVYLNWKLQKQKQENE